jgi:triosephosphate isomerase
MRKQIAAANWKMNLSFAEGSSLLDGILKNPFHLNEDRIVVFAVPFPYLVPLREEIKIPHMFLAAQDCSSHLNGAYTGEVSASMLKSIGVNYVIIGHSERREYHREMPELLAHKVDRALEQGLNPIFCCGEALDVRESGLQNEVVANQLKNSLFHLTDEQIRGFAIAYEPIWAIGTGKTASSAQAQEMHKHIRSVLAERYGKAIADTISILYGGSVKAANANELFSCPDVDGGLVGGASLIAAEFAAIIQNLK